MAVLRFESSPSFLAPSVPVSAVDDAVVVARSTRSGLVETGIFVSRVLLGLSTTVVVAVRFSVWVAIDKTRERTK